MYAIPVVFGFTCLYLHSRPKKQPKQSQPPSSKLILQRETVKLKQKMPQMLHLLLQSPEHNQQPIVEPFNEIIKRKGKRIRPLLVSLMARLFHSDQHEQTVYLIAILAEILHNASLIIDDIEDNSQQRRGQTCIHKLYGVDRAINAANYAYFRPLHNLLSHLPPQKTRRFLEIFLQEMTNLHLGQAEDIYCHKLPFGSDVWPQLVGNHDTYIRMVASKTGGLVRMMAKWVCCLFSSQSSIQQCLVSCMDNMAISFQIRDDLSNLNNTMGKGIRGEDIYERKITLMVIHIIQKSNTQFIKLFQKSTKSEEEVERIIKILEQSGSIAYAQQQCIAYGNKSLQILSQIPPSPQRQQLHSILQMIIHRSS